MVVVGTLLSFPCVSGRARGHCVKLVDKSYPITCANLVFSVRNLVLQLRMVLQVFYNLWGIENGSLGIPGNARNFV